jgi:putative ABC transport system permease protein
MMNSLKNFLKEIKSNPTSTIINVFGYSLALASCLVIGSFVYYQSTFDRFNVNKDRIFRMNRSLNENGTHEAITNHHWAEVLPGEITGIEKIARIGQFYESNIEFEKNDFKANGARGDKELFDIFSFPLIEKESEDFFAKPLSIAISQSLAQRIFGNTSPLGKTLKLGYQRDYTVTAVFKDIPLNSSFSFEFLVNTNDMLNDFGEQMKNHWAWWAWNTFILVKDQSIVSTFGERMKPLQNKYVGEWYANSNDYYLQPLSKIHFHSASIMHSFDKDIPVALVYIFISAGFLILVISCINFVNLSVAGFEARKKSVAIKKIIGASRTFLFKQYMSFSILLTFLCVLISLIIASYFIPWLKTLGITGIDIPYNKPFFWLIILSFSLFTGFLSGIYPSNHISKIVTLSSNNTIKVKSVFRNALITIQFTIAIFLLIASTTIKKQLNHSIKGNLGYEHASLLSFSVSEDVFNHYDAFDGEIKNINGVIATTSCGFTMPGDLGNYWPVKPSGGNVQINIFHSSVAPNFFDVLKIPLKVKFGEFKEDTTLAYDYVIINEEAEKQFEMGETILGKTYHIGETKTEVTGIAKDFHISSLHNKIKPSQFFIRNKNWNYIVQCETSDEKEIIAKIQQVWKKFEPIQPFKYELIDDMINQQYAKEKALLRLFNIFFVLSILISLIGLFGLVQLLLRFRVKEVGIRKVNGARVTEVMAMLNKDFVKWVAIAFVIACPIAWYAMNKWLQNFAYKTELSWWIFALAGALALGIAVLTVSWQSYRAASRNPVEALRYE